MNIARLSLLFCASFCRLTGTAAGECQFPRSWWGNWFQSGLGDMVITAKNISRKGVCYQHHRDYYLVENTHDKCHQCLLIISRHANIIQYKESYCIGPEPIDSLCSKIRVEAVLYTLVREPSQPVSCPFQSAFHLMYNNNSGGFCQTTTSYVHQCATDSKFLFRFRRCPTSAYTFDRDLELECVATWKDGSDMFIYGGFVSDGIISKEESYRCLMYSVQGTVVYLSMSADATCRGLRSPKDGPMVMELTEDVYGWRLTSQCDFPQWLLEKSWRDLSGKHRYTSRGGAAGNIALTYHRKATGPSHVLSSYTCTRSSHSNETDHDGLMILTHLLEDCEPRYQCLRLYRRHYHVIQLLKGNYVERDRQRCTAEDFTTLHSNQLLVSTELDSGSCPFVGRYRSIRDATGCQLEVTAGCVTKTRLDILSSCQSRPVLEMTCVLWWLEGDRLYLLAHELHKDDTSRLLCYSIRQMADTMEISHDRSCSQDPHNSSLGQTDSYAFRNYLDECLLDTLQPEVVGMKTVDDQEEQLPANGYSHVISQEQSKHDQRSVKDTFSDSTHMRAGVLTFVIIVIPIYFRFRYSMFTR